MCHLRVEADLQQEVLHGRDDNDPMPGIYERCYPEGAQGRGRSQGSRPEVTSLTRSYERRGGY